MDFGITGVAGITVICYLASRLLKATPLNEKWIPGLCGLLGAGLGVLALFFMPDWPVADVISSLAIGIVSGFAAVGVSQAYKQTRYKEK